MTINEAYKKVKMFVGNKKVVKYAEVNDGLVFITEDKFGDFSKTIGNNYFLVNNAGDVEITNPILCGLDTTKIRYI